MKNVINMETIKKDKTEKLIRVLFCFVIFLAIFMFILLISFVIFGGMCLLNYGG